MAPDLTIGQLCVGALLVLFAAILSLVLRLGVAKSLLFAALRSVLQLSMLGWVLSWLFAKQTGGLVLLFAVVMIAAAARAAVQRPSRSFAGAGWGAFATLMLSGTLTTIVVTQAVVGVSPWYQAQLVLPLLGMILGNSLTGVSLCLDSLLEALEDRFAVVECDLACGATRWEAMQLPLRDAVRRGMIPIINSMTVAGIVSLPGMMTGQILAGADPLVAVKYQIVVMFMLTAATLVGCFGVALFVFFRLFDDEHRLRHERVFRRN